MISKTKRRSETVNKELSDFTAQSVESLNSQPTICDYWTADQKIIERGLGYFTVLLAWKAYFHKFFNENNQVYMK